MNYFSLNLFFFILIYCVNSYSQQFEYTVHPDGITRNSDKSEVHVTLSNKKEVENIFGKDYLPLGSNGIYRMYYEKLGLTFFYVNMQDSTEEIYRIRIEEPATAITDDKLIVLNQTPISEVIKNYGHSRWTSSDSSDYWWYSYTDMEFYVLRDKSLPHFPLNELAHIKKIVKQIVIKCTNEDHIYYGRHM